MVEKVLHFPSIHFEHGPEIFLISPDDYQKMERGYKQLSRRSLLLAGPEDTVIMDKSPDPEYLARLKALGAGGAVHLVPGYTDGSCLADDVAGCPDTISKIREWSGRVEPYMITKAEERLKETLGRSLCEATSSVTSLLNDKVFFIRMAEDLGLPRIDTFIGPPDAAASRITKEGGPVIVRGARSVGGSGVWVAKTRESRLGLGKKVEKIKGGMFLVQPFIDNDTSPNLQFYIGKSNICLLGQTIQILDDDLSHTGNLFDVVEDQTIRNSLLDQGKALAREAASIGYNGILGVDFIVTRSGEAYAVELNARHNTSTHALWFVNRFFNGDPFIPLESGRGLFVQFPVNQARSAMDWIKMMGGLSFNPDTGTGIMPYDCGSGHMHAVIVGEESDHRKWLTAKAGDIAR